MTTCPRCGRDEARPTFDGFCDDCWIFAREGNKLAAASPYCRRESREQEQAAKERREAKRELKQKCGEP